MREAERRSRYVRWVRTPDLTLKRLSPWLPTGPRGWVWRFIFRHPAVQPWLSSMLPEVEDWYLGAYHYAVRTQAGIQTGLNRWAVGGPREVPWTD